MKLTIKEDWYDDDYEEPISVEDTITSYVTINITTCYNPETQQYYISETGLEDYEETPVHNDYDCETDGGHNISYEADIEDYGDIYYYMDKITNSDDYKQLEQDVANGKYPGVWCHEFVLEYVQDVELWGDYDGEWESFDIYNSEVGRTKLSDVWYNKKFKREFKSMAEVKEFYSKITSLESGYSIDEFVEDFEQIEQYF